MGNDELVARARQATADGAGHHELLTALAEALSASEREKGELRETLGNVLRQYDEKRAERDIDHALVSTLADALRGLVDVPHVVPFDARTPDDGATCVGCGAWVDVGEVIAHAEHCPFTVAASVLGLVPEEEKK